MPASDTLIAALKFKGGAVLGSDSQTSDDMVSVRWPTEKPQQIGNHPLVVATSGAGGRGRQAIAALQGANFQPTTFQKPERVLRMVDGKLRPIYDVLKTEAANKFPYGPTWEVVLTVLGVYWAGGGPHVFDCSKEGDYPYPHDCFHAIGSAGQTAYAIFRTLGGIRLAEVDESLAVLAMLRILRTAIHVEMSGVSEPVYVWVVKDGKAHKLTKEQVNENMEGVYRWEVEDQENFLARGVRL